MREIKNIKGIDLVSWCINRTFGILNIYVLDAKSRKVVFVTERSNSFIPIIEGIMRFVVSGGNN